MQKRQRLGHRLQVQGPVERRVAAADDEHVAAAEMVHLAHRVEHRVAFILLDAGKRRALRREGSAAGGDHHHLGFDHRAGVGREPEAAVEPLERLHPLIEMELGAERLDLVHELVGQLLAGDDGQAGNVVDRLLRIELGALAAGAVENVDHVALDVDQAELEHGEEADWPSPNDHGIGLDDVFGHGQLRTASRECARRGRRARR